jgi:beta-alanine degradation protein BauB
MSTPRNETAWPDPAKAATDVYSLVMENDRVRVFDVRFKPGQKTVMHGHPDHVVYVLADYTLDLMLPDGTRQDVSLKAGQTIWMGAGAHAAKNIGATEGRAVVIELKGHSRIGQRVNPAGRERR